MRKLLIITLLLTITMATFAQRPARRKARLAPGLTQLCGTVLEMRGNRMPAPNPSLATSTAAGTPLVREVLVFPVMSLDSVSQDESGFFTNVTAKPIATIMSNQAGKFCLTLPAGQYSVLIREPKGLYANLFDTKNRINTAIVQAGKTATMTILVSHSATY